MEDAPLEPRTLTESDLVHHVVKLGIDVYPPIEIDSERTRLNMFYEEARGQWDELFDRLVASDTEFKISKAFGQRPGKLPAIPIDTFVLTPRGPVFVLPLLLPPPIGSTGLADRALDLFNQVRRLFFSALGGPRECLRVGMVRELMFDTSADRCLHLIARDTTFAGADLVGGIRGFVFRDQKCNVRMEMEPVEITKTIQLPVGANVQQHAGYGLRVVLDVNNAEFRPMTDADINEVLERASGLWADELLRFVNERSTS